jgi:hypothetical protein
MTQGMGGLGGGGKAASGAKYVLMFSVEGNGELKIDHIAKGLTNIGHSAEGAKEGVDKLVSMEGLEMGAEAVEKMTEAGAHLMEFGAAIFEGWGKGFETLLEKGSEFEQLLIRIRSTGKTADEAQKMVQGAVDIASTLPITELQATRIMQTMATAHVDGLAKIGESYEELAAKGKALKGLDTVLGTGPGGSWDKFKKEGPSAVSLFADTLAAAGQLGGKDATVATHELAELIETGKLGSMMRFGALTGDLRKVGHGAHDAAGRLKLMMKMLEEKGAIGAAQATMFTLEGQLTNLKGILDMVSLAIMEPGKPGGLMDQFVHGLKSMIDTIREFFNPHGEQGQKFLAMLKEVLGFVAGPILWGMQKLTQAVQVLFTFMGDNPGLMKFLAGLSLVVGLLSLGAGAFLVVTGTVLGFVVAVMAAVAAVGALEVELLPLIAVVVYAGVVFAAWGAGAIGVAVAMYEAYQHNFAGIKDAISDVLLVGQAFYEAFQTWNKGVGTISEATAQKLEQRGLVGVFLSIGNVIRQVQATWDRFSEVVEMRWESISQKFGNAWDRFSGAFGRVVTAIRDVLTVLTESFGGGQKAVDEATATGGDWGMKLADILEGIADFAQMASSLINELIPSSADMADSLANVYEVVMDVGTALHLVWDIGMAAFDVLAAQAQLAMTVISPLLDVITGIAHALADLAAGNFAAAGHALEGIVDNAAKDAWKHFKAAGEDTEAAGSHILGVGSDVGGFGRNADTAEAMRARGRAPGTPYDVSQGVDNGPVVDNRPFYEKYPAQAPGKATGGTAPAPGGAEAEGRAGANVASAPTPAPTPLNLKGDVHIDGETIGKIVWKHIQSEMERAGFHPVSA